MDKVQLALGYVRKYHFWLLCVAAMGAGLFGWMSARGSLSEAYQKNKSAIDGKFGSLQTIQGEANPPNDTWKEAIDKLTGEGREKVAEAWQEVYNEQQQVLTWPEAILGSDFTRWIKNNKPTDEIPRQWREQYRNEVVNVEFPKLVTIVDAKLAIEDGDAPKKDDEGTHVYQVVWSDDSQQKVQKSLQMAPTQVPTSEVMRLRQEDLWVYHALLNIIRQTNETAKYSSNVKRINALLIGADAAREFQKGMQPGHIESIKTGGEGEDAGTGTGAPTEAQAGGEESGGEIAPDAGRYVGDDGNPLGPGVAATEQFKRLPVYMNLVMNQNEINRLLMNCANYPLPVEVKQLRINPKGSTEKKEEEKRQAGDAMSVSMTEPGPLDVTVEIHGIIYIFNPPDPTKLGLPGPELGVGG